MDVGRMRNFRNSHRKVRADAAAPNLLSESDSVVPVGAQAGREGQCGPDLHPAHTAQLVVQRTK